jgi:hypothetical protein
VAVVGRNWLAGLMGLPLTISTVYTNKPEPCAHCYCKTFSLFYLFLRHKSLSNQKSQCKRYFSNQLGSSTKKCQ